MKRCYTGGEEMKVQKILSNKVEDYLGRQYLHNLFDQKGDFDHAKPAIYPFQTDLFAGCRYHRHRSIPRTKYVNPLMPINNTEFTHIYDTHKLRESRAEAYDRITETARALFSCLPVEQTSKFYNSQYFCKNSRMRHKVMHAGAIFNFNHCRCKSSNLMIDKEFLDDVKQRGKAINNMASFKNWGSQGKEDKEAEGTSTKEVEGGYDSDYSSSEPPTVANRPLERKQSTGYSTSRSSSGCGSSCSNRSSLDERTRPKSRAKLLDSRQNERKVSVNVEPAKNDERAANVESQNDLDSSVQTR